MGGFWTDNYWPENYWTDNYWIGGGTPTPTPTRRRSGGPSYKRDPRVRVEAMTRGPHRRREPWTWQERVKERV